MLLQHEMEIGANETAPELAARMSEAGAPLMVETLRGIAAGTLSGRAQDPAAATYAPMMKKDDGRIEWSRTAREIYNRMRGFAPWPGAFTTCCGERRARLWGEPVCYEKCAAGRTLPGTIHVRQDGDCTFRAEGQPKCAFHPSKWRAAVRWTRWNMRAEPG